jgi:PadR family transcriptional regulator PadR
VQQLVAGSKTPARLESAGLVGTYRAESDGGPPRKYYQLSPRGRSALAAGVAEWRSTRDAVDAVLGLVEAEVYP